MLFAPAAPDVCTFSATGPRGRSVCLASQREAASQFTTGTSRRLVLFSVYSSSHMLSPYAYLRRSSLTYHFAPRPRPAPKTALWGHRDSQQSVRHVRDRLLSPRTHSGVPDHGALLPVTCTRVFSFSVVHTKLGGSPRGLALLSTSASLTPSTDLIPAASSELRPGAHLLFLDLCGGTSPGRRCEVTSYRQRKRRHTTVRVFH